ncbi:MAG: exodeoxyribonuclease VII large subunit, partial [Acidobacteriales bacterium]|nr:exodeoxyribonuclease VII large subunit [Terriglobales bacterium]
EGEMSNYRPSSSGHMYFTIKDGDAQISAVMFRSSARLLRFRPDNGMLLIGRGRVTIYDQRGQLQINVEYLEPKGAGALQIAFEQLKAKLSAEGLFDAERKKPIPKLPRVVGIVTSQSGAAIRDILNVLQRRHEDVHILVWPAQVQGETAAREIADGIRYFNKNQNADVLIVARGGGSVEDLAAFNDEGLARTIAASAIPIISAIGHETDFTIADFVADLRAPTPSAAAELVVEAKHQLEASVRNLHDRLKNMMRYRLALSRQRVNAVSAEAAFERMRHLVHRHQQHVDQFTFRLLTVERSRLQALRQRLDVAQARVRHHDLRRTISLQRHGLERGNQQLAATMSRLLAERSSRLGRLQSQLHALSPLRVLERGYSLAFDDSGTLIKSVEQVREGQELRTQFADGEAKSRVTSRRGPGET